MFFKCNFRNFHYIFCCVSNVLLLFFCISSLVVWCLTTLSSVRCTKAAVSSVTNLGEIKVYHHTIVLCVLHLYVCSESFQWISNNCSKCSSSNRNNSLATPYAALCMYSHFVCTPYIGNTRYKQCIQITASASVILHTIVVWTTLYRLASWKNVEHLKIAGPSIGTKHHRHLLPLYDVRTGHMTVATIWLHQIQFENRTPRTMMMMIIIQ